MLTITAKHPKCSVFNLSNSFDRPYFFLLQVFLSFQWLFLCQHFARLFRCFTKKMNNSSAGGLIFFPIQHWGNLIWTACFSVVAEISANICIKMRNNTFEQVPWCCFDLRWLTRQKGQCRADGPYFRSQEAQNPAELTETSLVCGCRDLSHSAGTSLHEPESIWPLGLIASGPHWFSVTPRSLVLPICSRLLQHTSGSWGTTGSNQNWELFQSSASLQARFSGSQLLSACLSQACRSKHVQLTHQTSSCRDARTLGHIRGSTYLPLENKE